MLLLDTCIIESFNKNIKMDTPLKVNHDSNSSSNDNDNDSNMSSNSNENIPNINDLEMTFSGMKLKDINSIMNNKCTIEGSPLVLRLSKHIINTTTSNNNNITTTSNNNNNNSNIIRSTTPLLDESPVAKKIDLNQTPSRNDLISSLSSSSLSYNINNTIYNNKKVYILSSGSDEHDTGNHQENARRTALLCGDNGCLRRYPLQNYIEWGNTDNVKLAPLTDILRVHDYAYFQHLQQKCKDADISLSKFNNDISKNPSFYAPPGMLDSDTPLVHQSLDASRKFCGAAMIAVDKVMSGSHDRAFVLGRPPGHHAGPNGCVPSKYFYARPDMTSSGFCLLNTVAVAAGYARYQYGRQAFSNSINQSKEIRAPKIAIVDIDIHHGNGTEEIIRNLKPRTVFLPTPSSWAPVSMQQYKPWFNEQDADEIFFSSINLFAEDRFYPCSGNDSCENSSKNGINNIVNIGLTPIGPGPWDSKARAKLTSSQRYELCVLASNEMRQKVSEQLIPELTSFQPDILFISAGFDAHYDDLYHFLTEKDFHWLTEQLCHVASLSNGKVISILEGGYSLESPVKNNKTNTTTQNATSTTTSITGRARQKNKRYIDPDDETSSSSSSSSRVESYEQSSKDDPSTCFAQLPGDGGLVKGVLSHVAAMAGVQTWI